MKTLFHIIVKSVKPYTDKTISGIQREVYREDANSVFREVEVVSVPHYSNYNIGDILLIHHNVLRKINGYNGVKLNSHYHLGNSLYYVEEDMIFMRKSKNEEDFKAVTPYLFIEPIYIEKEQSLENDLKLNKSYKQRINNEGVIAYSNDQLTRLGIKEGDRIVFSKDSEYEFVINNKIYYRLKTKDVLMKK